MICLEIEDEVCLYVSPRTSFRYIIYETAVTMSTNRRVYSLCTHALLKVMIGSQGDSLVCFISNGFTDCGWVTSVLSEAQHET